MKIEKIIEKLCSHDISKQDAIEQIKSITDGLRKNDAFEFQVESVSFSVENNHAFLKIKLPYGYSKIENKVKSGDSIDVIFLP